MKRWLKLLALAVLAGAFLAAPARAADVQVEYEVLPCTVSVLRDCSSLDLLVSMQTDAPEVTAFYVMLTYRGREQATPQGPRSVPPRQPRQMTLVPVPQGQKAAWLFSIPAGAVIERVTAIAFAELGRGQAATGVQR